MTTQTLPVCRHRKEDTVQLSRQHFQFIADVLRDERETYDPAARVALEALEAAAWRFADRLASTNPNFDRARFLTAAGVGE